MLAEKAQDGPALAVETGVYDELRKYSSCKIATLTCDGCSGPGDDPETTVPAAETLAESDVQESKGEGAGASGPEGYEVMGSPKALPI